MGVLHRGTARAHARTCTHICTRTHTPTFQDELALWFEQEEAPGPHCLNDAEDPVLVLPQAACLAQNLQQMPRDHDYMDREVEVKNSHHGHSYE